MHNEGRCLVCLSMPVGDCRLLSVTVGYLESGEKERLLIWAERAPTISVSM